MFRAGANNKIANSEAVSTPFKAPAPAPAPVPAPVRLSVPAEGGTSERDRTFDPSQSRSHGHGNRGGEGGNSNRHGHSYGNHSSSQTGGSQSSSKSYGGGGGANAGRQGSSWAGRGQEGFQLDLDPGRVYRDDSSNPLVYMKPGQPARTNFKNRGALDPTAQRLQQTAKDRAAEVQERKQAMRVAEARREADQAQRQREQVQNDEATYHKNLADNRSQYLAKKAARSTSTVASQSASGPSSSASAPSSSSNNVTVGRKVTDKYNSKPPVDLASANEKSRAFLLRLAGDDKPSDDTKNVSSTEEIVVMPKPITKQGTANDKGKGKERARDDSHGTDAPMKKATSLGKLRKATAFDSPSPEKTKNKQRDTAAENPKSEKQKKQKDGNKSLADQYAEEQEGREMDAAIERANEEAKKAKMTELDDSDVEVVDPLAEHDENDDGGTALDGEDQPEREETPDDLLVNHEEELDPSRLCPFCDQALPDEPSDRLTSLRQYLLARPNIESRLSARNPDAKYLPIVEIASFCQLHKVERTVIPEGIKRGYPMKINWNDLPRRIETQVGPHLSGIILGATPSRFIDLAKQDWDKNNGFKRTNITAEWDSFHFEEPGYYGPRGFECIHATVTRLFTANDDAILTADRVAPFSRDYYVRRVLVPETALELTRVDLGLAQTAAGVATAARVVERSRAFGNAQHAIVENVDRERRRARDDEVRRVEAARADEAHRAEQRRVAAERAEAADEERRIAAATPQYRLPKALLAATRAAPPSSSSSSAASTTTSKKRAAAPAREDDDDEDEPVVVAAAAAAESNRKPQRPVQPRPPAAQLGTNQPGIRNFFAPEQPQERRSVSSSSHASKGKEPLVLGSSSDSDSDLDRPALAKSSTKTKPQQQKKKKRRASSSEKPHRAVLSDSDSDVEDDKREKKMKPTTTTTYKKTKRRASSPIASPSPKKKKKQQQQQKQDDEAPRKIQDQTNVARDAARELERALAACSDLESEVETNFQAKNRTAATRERERRQERANERRKRTLAQKRTDAAAAERLHDAANRRSKDPRAKRRRAADSSDSG
ncbi:hypothetical protein JCM11491_003463 [Sporobolomyces phaffii]